MLAHKHVLINLSLSGESLIKIWKGLFVFYTVTVPACTDLTEQETTQCVK